MRNKGHNLGYIHIWKGENYLFNLKNREEKEKYFSTKSWKSKGERAVQYKNLVKLEEEENCFLKILTMERRMTHETSYLKLQGHCTFWQRHRQKTVTNVQCIVCSGLVWGWWSCSISYYLQQWLSLSFVHSSNPQSPFYQFETNSAQKFIGGDGTNSYRRWV